jgi:hypothetical protein
MFLASWVPNSSKVESRKAKVENLRLQRSFGSSVIGASLIAWNLALGASGNGFAELTVIRNWLIGTQSSPEVPLP